MSRSDSQVNEGQRSIFFTSESDIIFNIVLIGLDAINGALSFPRKIKNWRDPLRMMREAHFLWLTGFGVVITSILLITDPGNVYADGVFNWRTLTLIKSNVLTIY